MRLERILVPLDGSNLGELALPRATDLARPAGGTIMLVRAAAAHPMLGDTADAQVLAVREAEEYLERVATRLRAEGAKNVETSVWYGPAALSIVEAARLRRADLIVMSSHGRSGLGRLILGSVAESVLRGTSVPILLVRAAEAPVQAPPGEARAKETARA